MTFQVRFTCLQSVLSGESGLCSVNFWFFFRSIFATVFLPLVLHVHVIQKATLEPASQFSVSSGAGMEHSDLLHTDAWQLKQ